MPPPIIRVGFMISGSSLDIYVSGILLAVAAWSSRDLLGKIGHLSTENGPAASDKDRFQAHPMTHLPRPAVIPA